MSDDENRTSRLPLILGFLGVCALAGGGVILYQMLPKGSSPEAAQKAFDLDRVPEDRPQAASAPAAPRTLAPAGQSSLTPINLGASDKPYQEAAPAKKTIAVSEETRRQAEERIRQLAIRYTQKYPVIEQYGREWMSYPDLRKLANDYAADRDPVKFMQGLAQSPNFPKMIKKYARSPEVQAFVTDGMKQAPGEAIAAAAGFFKDDKAVKSIVSTVLGALGLPSGLLESAENGKVDQAAMMNSITKDHPELKGLMSDPATQKAARDSQSR